MGALERWLQRQWYRSGPAQLVLLPLSWLFAVLTWLRRLGYRVGLLPAYKLSVPVILVGNISIGGTGKTPLVLWLAEQLQQQGWSPGIISRGYGGHAQEATPVDADSAPSRVGDEPVLLARRSGCPVWVGRDRVGTAQALLAANPQCDIIISDDGLQHYRLRRDVEIAVVDGQRGLGNGRLLPAGPLRESRARLGKVDAVVINGGESGASGYKMRLEAGALHNLRDPARTVEVADLNGRSVCAVAGIGNPSRFFRQLQGMGLQFEQRAFPDHHAFKPNDLQSLKAEAILMTEKDAVKCAAFAQEHWWYLPVRAVIAPELLARIMQKLRK